MTTSQSGRTERSESQDDVSIMTNQDYLISIENAMATLCRAGKAADVAHVLMVFGHGAKSVEDLVPSDYDTVFGELFQRETDLRD